jgi:hypothetical protein
MAFWRTISGVVRVSLEAASRQDSTTRIVMKERNEQDLAPGANRGDPVLELTPVVALTIPWGQQQVELQQVNFASGGMPLLRVRIREGRRFTIFDIDANSAAQWGKAMVDWAQSVPASATDTGTRE